jgi:hypothetical protein
MNLWRFGLGMALLGFILCVIGFIAPMLADWFPAARSIQVGVVFWIVGVVILVGTTLLEALL